jgi:hypothetical protein
MAKSNQASPVAVAAAAAVATPGVKQLQLLYVKSQSKLAKVWAFVPVMVLFVW